jgi:hypothetical protein
VLLSFLGIKVPEKPFVKDPDDKRTNLYVLHKKGYPNFYLSPDQLTDITEALDYLFETMEVKGEEFRSMYSYLTINLLPEFSYENVTYCGPANKLFNLKFDEYINAEENYLAFLHSKDEKDLNKLVATLYRHRDPDYDPFDINTTGDPRELFNDNLILSRAEAFVKLKLEKKYAIFLYYQGCRNFITMQFPTAHKPPKKKSNNKYGLLGLVDALTGGDVTKNENVRKAQLFDIMIRLEQAAIQLEEIEEKTKK